MSTVLLIGASNDSGRYSYRALHELIANGHRVIPVNPKSIIDTSEPTIAHLSLVNEKIDIAVVYVRPVHLKPQIDELVRIAPDLVIFNPGSESPELQNELESKGIRTQEACTLVLLSIGQFGLEQE